MKTLLLSIVVLLTACGTVPVKQHFPDFPADLSKPCKDLLLIESKTITLSKLMDTVAKNYELRHECAAQVDGLIRWHAEQKKIFDEANK